MATLASYITEVRRLLHDANGVFWSDTELTDDINAARERVVRDTGCLRNLQVTSTPLSSTGVVATNWTVGDTVTAGQFLFSGIFIYQVVTGGTVGEIPAYPSATYAYPPSGTFTTTDGTAVYQYDSPCEIISLAAIPESTLTLDVLNINLFWGNSRIPLRYLPWTNFNAQLRYWQNYVGRPVCFSMYGQGQIYIGPVPDQSYVIEIDSVILPTPLSLSATTQVDEIVDPYTTVVKYYAAHVAKYYEQSFGEAELYLQQYKQKTQSVLVSTYTRRIPDPYNNPY